MALANIVGLVDRSGIELLDLRDLIAFKFDDRNGFPVWI